MTLIWVVCELLGCDGAYRVL